MSSPVPNPTAAIAREAAPHRGDLRRRLLAALLSAFTPGAGQLVLGQRRRGTVLLLIFVALLCCVWALRLPRYYVGLIIVVLTWLGLSLYASCAALLERSGPAARPLSKWWLLTIAPLVYVGINLIFTPLLLASGFRAMNFGSSAMEPTLFVGDHFVIDKTYYRHEPVGRDDLVVVRRKDYLTVKRVIAVGGDTIEARNRQILVNGQLLDEPFIQHSRPAGTDPEMDSFGPITVPEGRYFVMGDNRDVSLDSRTSEFGLVEASAIVGKPLYIHWSSTKTRRGKDLN